MRKIIAARLTESKATIPHYYTRMECNIDRMLEYRKILKIAGVKVSVNDLVIVAAALALRDVPEANSFWDGSSIQQNATVDISVAVATDGGLITPIVKDADRIGLSVSCLFCLFCFVCFVCFVCVGLFVLLVLVCCFCVLPKELLSRQCQPRIESPFPKGRAVTFSRFWSSVLPPWSVRAAPSERNTPVGLYSTIALEP